MCQPTPAVVTDSEDELALYSCNEGLEEVEFIGLTAGADPCTYKHAMASPDADKWKQATDAEIQTLMSNATWEVIDLPAGKKAIGSGWVFKVK